MLLLIGALLSTLLVGISQPNAQAVDPPQVWDTSGLSPQEMRVHGDGSVTITDCNNYTQQTDSSITSAAKTFSATGELITELPKVTSDGWTSQTCQQTSAVGTDSAFFVLQEKGWWPYKGRIVAYKNGVTRWSHSYKCNGGQDLRPQAMTLGSDGNIYGVFYDAGSACSEYANGERVLIGIDASDGSEIFRQTMTVTESWNYVWLYAQESKLVVKTDKELFFFDYNGSPLTSQTVLSGSLYNDRFQYYVGMGKDSIVYQLKKNNQLASGPNACSSFRQDATLFLKQDNSPPVDIGLDDCEYLYKLLVLPDGDIVYVYQDQASGQYRLKRRTISGTTIYDFAVTDLPGYDVYVNGVDQREDWISADENGNVYLKRRVKQVPSNSLSDIDIRVDKVDDTGTVTNVFSTAELDDSNTYESRAGMYTQFGGLAGDKLYVPICKNQCSPTAQSFIAVVDVATGFDYPRSTIFAEHQQLNYVALGDSFSSGEGVEPFDPDTDEEDVNECHRSEKAYSKILSNVPGAKLKLTKFVACSGAMTSNIINVAQWNESSAQYTALAGADVVTVSIGGNDVSFEPTIRRCITEASGLGIPGDCDDALDASEDQVDALDVVLDNALDKIESEIGSETQVYIVGYPHIMPQSRAAFNPVCSAWTFSSTGLSRIWDLTDSLNDVIFDEVVSRDNRFHYVDPTVEFSGHELCTTTPYINELTVPLVYSLHPNEEGQRAYARAIKLALS